jgi:hypothetical protein
MGKDLEGHDGNASAFQCRHWGSPRESVVILSALGTGI